MEALAQMRMITEADFCTLLNITPKTAAAWRYRGQSPAFSKVGNTVFYAIGDVEAFIRERTKSSGHLKGIL
jgi:hypothetical protein